MHAFLAVRRCLIGQLLRQPCYAHLQLASLHPEGFQTNNCSDLFCCKRNCFELLQGQPGMKVSLTAKGNANR